MLTVEQLSRLYRVYAIDYEYTELGISQHRGDWLLVAAGTGVMMSIMDAEPRFRWCVDVDGLKTPGANLAEWLSGMEYLTGRICVVGGWAITRPDSLADSLRRLQRPVVVYPITVQDPNIFHGLDRVESMSAFLARIAETSENCAPLALPQYA